MRQTAIATRAMAESPIRTAHIMGWLSSPVWGITAEAAVEVGCAAGAAVGTGVVLGSLGVSVVIVEATYRFSTNTEDNV